MVRITVFTNSGVRIFVTKDYETIKNFTRDLGRALDGRMQCIWFEDINGILVTISPIGCIIEVEEIKENDNAS